MTDVLNVPVKLADGHETTLNDHRGKVILVVNVASKCGLTVQYEGLEKLYEDKRERGFVIAAFPANNFKGQEPGTDAEIVEFCTPDLRREIPDLLEDLGKGRGQASALPTADSRCRVPPPATVRCRSGCAPAAWRSGDNSEILWNFEKFLVGRDGKVAARFAPDVTAEDQPGWSRRSTRSLQGPPDAVVALKRSYYAERLPRRS